MLSRCPIAERRVTRLPEVWPTAVRILLSGRGDTPASPVSCHTTHLHDRFETA
ncbi:MAG TPA: hypothetical protein VNB06_18025 [Thermoanaerobaculia bacterium]|nr:hypothetical protein [Thermoanaerobaculia bacterium]